MLSIRNIQTNEVKPGIMRIVNQIKAFAFPIYGWSILFIVVILIAGLIPIVGIFTSVLSHAVYVCVIATAYTATLQTGSLDIPGAWRSLRQSWGRIFGFWISIQLIFFIGFVAIIGLGAVLFLTVAGSDFANGDVEFFDRIARKFLLGGVNDQQMTMVIAGTMISATILSLLVVCFYAFAMVSLLILGVWRRPVIESCRTAISFLTSNVLVVVVFSLLCLAPMIGPLLVLGLVFGALFFSGFSLSGLYPFLLFALLALGGVMIVLMPLYIWFLTAAQVETLRLAIGDPPSDKN